MVEALAYRRRKDTIYLLKSNSRSEDVLDYPAQLLSEFGMQVIRIIDLEDPEGTSKTHALLNRATGLEVRIISSAHFLLSSATMAGRLKPSQWVDYRIHEFMSLADTVRILRPERLYWLSHDIFDPFLREDVPFLPLAHAVFLPTNELADEYRPYNRNVHVAGWPRLTPRLAELTTNRAYRSAWFVSFFQTIQERWSPEAFADEVKPLTDAGVMLKFPAWTNTRPYEEAIRASGGACVDSAETSLDLLAQTELPIITAHSGLEGEAQLLSKPYIRLHFPIRTFDRMPGKPFAECCDLHEAAELVRTARVEAPSAPVPCFDSRAFLAAVLEDCPRSASLGLSAAA